MNYSFYLLTVDEYVDFNNDVAFGETCSCFMCDFQTSKLEDIDSSRLSSIIYSTLFFQLFRRKSLFLSIMCTFNVYVSIV